MPFSDDLTLTKLKKGLWKTEHEFTYTWGKYRITVPAGYVTDLASVPRGFWNLIPKDGTYDQAAVLHDYIYGTHSFDRKTCDRIFLEAMKELGVGWWTRGTIYNAVRAFGWIAY